MSDKTTPTRKSRSALPFSNEYPGGIARELDRVTDMLRRAMDHGLDGADHYHSVKAGDLGDEVRAFLDERKRRDAAFN